MNVQHERCTIIESDFGIFVQGLLGLIALVTLFYKRMTEHPQRDWLTWARDTSKQAIGATLAHWYNVLFAEVVQSPGQNNPCVFYFVVFMVDSVVGCAISFLFLRGVEHLATRCKSDLLRSGFYGRVHGTECSYWGAQMSVWLGIVTVVKVILIFCILLPFRDVLYPLGELCLVLVSPFPRLELLTVMIVVPLVVNVFVFWVQDSFLKHQVTEEETAEAEAEGLVPESHSTPGLGRSQSVDESTETEEGESTTVPIGSSAAPSYRPGKIAITAPARAHGPGSNTREELAPLSATPGSAASAIATSPDSESDSSAGQPSRVGRTVSGPNKPHSPTDTWQWAPPYHPGAAAPDRDPSR